MTIYNQGLGNPAALTVPGLSINVQAPPPANINGVPTNIGGIVGTATWGPVNSPVIAGGPNDASLWFGQPQNRKYDLMTHVVIASQLGLNNFRLVRVTDGTDVAATIAVLTNCITLTAKYTGTLGNSLQASIGPG